MNRRPAYLPGREAALLAVDEISRVLLERSRPLRFRAARSVEEIAAAQQLRYDAVVKHGWAPPGNLPRNREVDGYDAQALQLLAVEGNAIAGGTRLIFPEAGRLLPTEAIFDLCLDDGQTVDHGRIVAGQNAGHHHGIFMGLLAQSWKEIRGRGYSKLCGTASYGMIRLCDRVGIALELVGPAREYWGELRCPYVWDPVRSRQSLSRRWLGWSR